MFKASLQRQAQLGHVARRQISSFALRSSVLPSRSFVALSKQTLSQTAVRSSSLLPRSLIPRFYSSESAAVREDEGDASSSSGPVTKFADLVKLGVDENLVQALTKGMGYENMTEVQALTINPAMKGVDLVAQAKTGTGKTLAFLVPVFQRVLNAQPDLARYSRTPIRPSSQDIRAIILSPTRELAEQIGVEAKKLARNTGIVVQTAVGGTRKREALFNMQRQGCHILVATPGRLQDILTDPDARVAAPNCQAFVLDEADRMLDVGFADAIRDIVDLLPDIKKVDRQTLLFSATIPRDVVHLAKSMVKTDNFEFIQTIRADDEPTHHRVPQHIVAVKGYENWFPTIMEIAHKGLEKNKEDPGSAPFKAIIFFSNTATVEYANKVLRRTSLGERRGGIPIYDIHSRLTQAARTRNADDFRRSKSGILVSSDVTARGMDFPGVTHVIQVGLPPDRDQYIHRVGRTGRAGKEGQGWLVLAEEEISEARQRLADLPIKPNHTIDAAKHQVGEGDAPPHVARYIDELNQAHQTTPPSMFRALYMAMLGQKFGRRLQIEDVIQLLNGWSNALGRERPPAIPPKVAQNRGIRATDGARIGHDDDEDAEFFAKNPRAFDGRGGFGGGSRQGGFSSGGRSGGFNSGGRSGGYGSGGGRSGGGFSSGGGRSGGGFSSGGSRSGGFNNGRRGNSFEDKFGSRNDGDRNFGRRDGGRGGGRDGGRGGFGGGRAAF